MTISERADSTPINPTLFRGLVFDHAVSLGGNCEPAHQLRRIGRLQRSLFDWLVTPLHAIPRILADDGQRLATRFVTCHGGTSVRCGAYDVLYHHEFPRAEDHSVCFDTAAIEHCRSKMAHKWTRFVETCEAGGRVLFVRFPVATDLPWDPAHENPQRIGSGIHECVEALARRFPALDFRLLLLFTGDTCPAINDDRVATKLLRKAEKGDWAISDSSWDALLQSIAFSAKPAAAVLGETLYWSGEPEEPVTSSKEPGAVPDATVFTDGVAHEPDRLDCLRASLDAASRLRSARDVAKLDDEAAIRTARECLTSSSLSPQLRQAAGLILSAGGHDEDALAALSEAARRAPGLPDIEEQIAVLLSRLGRQNEALVYLRRAAAAEPFRPHVLRRLTMLEIAAGNADAVLATVTAALDFEVESATLAVDAGRALWAAAKSFHAAKAFDLAFTAGVREPSFLRDHLGLLTGETRYADVLAAAKAIGPSDDGQVSQKVMLTGHARLALAYDRADEIATAERRERSADWLSPEALLATIRRHLDDRQPFSFIRVGDGEARFLIATCPDLRPQLAEDEASAIGEVVWQNWFGELLGTTDKMAVRSLADDYTLAVRDADVIGVSDALRLRQDTGHYGYLAFQETWLRHIAVGKRHQWASALAHRDLERLSPGLAVLLEGLDALGVISPHPGLGDALAARFGIAVVAATVIPAEGRLPTAAQTRAIGRHFPDIYRRVLATLALPRPGCLVLVAGGLLGKVYCNRVRELGGVALDIGALADAWMGYDTRDGQFKDAGRLA